MQLFLAILLLSCAQFGSQIFLPALPELALYFDISNTKAQQIIMLYFIGFGLSQLLFGPWSDNAGRRKIFLIGQALFILGTLLCALATSPTMLAWGRILQGIGAGAPVIVSRTLLSDSYNGFELKQVMASLAVAASVVSLIAPVLGGWISTETNWQSLFIIVCVYLILSWCIGFKLLPRRNIKQSKTSFIAVLIEYKSLLGDSRFITPSLFKWLPTMIFLSSATFLPFEIQQKLSLSAQDYGLYMMIPTSGLILGTSLIKIVQRHFSYESILAIFWPLLVAAGIILYVLPFSLWATLTAYTLFMISAGAFFPCSLHLLIEPFRDKAGTVNALCGATDMFVFSTLAVLVNKYWIDDIHSMGLFYLVVCLVLAINWILMHLRKRSQKLQEKLQQQVSINSIKYHEIG
jgi:MFS transporter, DHA1 family, 2-module integral membrane pump EmrD